MCRWSRGLPDDAEVRAEDFYGDAACNAAYRHFVKTILLRVNTLTGVFYK